MCHNGLPVKLKNYQSLIRFLHYEGDNNVWWIKLLSTLKNNLKNISLVSTWRKYTAWKNIQKMQLYNLMRFKQIKTKYSFRLSKQVNSWDQVEILSPSSLWHQVKTTKIQQDRICKIQEEKVPKIQAVYAIARHKAFSGQCMICKLWCLFVTPIIVLYQKTFKPFKTWEQQFTKFLKKI